MVEITELPGTVVDTVRKGWVYVNHPLNGSVRNYRLGQITGRRDAINGGVLDEIHGASASNAEAAYKARMFAKAEDFAAHGGVGDRVVRSAKTVVRTHFSLAGKALKLGFFAGLLGGGALLLSNMNFGKKKGGAEAVKDAMREGAAEPQVFTAEQSFQLPPLEIDMAPSQAAMPMMPTAAMGGEGASLMDSSGINANRVAQLSANRLGGNYAGGMAAQKEFAATAQPSVS